MAKFSGEFSIFCDFLNVLDISCRVLEELGYLKSIATPVSEIGLLNSAETFNKGNMVSEWVSSFLTAHQHNIGYAVPYY